MKSPNHHRAVQARWRRLYRRNLKQMGLCRDCPADNRAVVEHEGDARCNLCKHIEAIARWRQRRAAKLKQAMLEDHGAR